MAQQTINIGSVANDGTGDPLRTAFDKVNDNFTELYADDAGDVNSVNAGTGISVDQTTGAVTVTNSAPDQTVSLADGGNIGISGTYPSFTLTNSAPNATHTGEVTGATALTIANDVITSAKLGTQYKTDSAVAGTDFDFSTAQIFTKTISGATTITFSNVTTGDIKLFYMAGDTAPTFPSGTVINGEWVNDVVNIIQVARTGSIYIYSINQQV